MCFTTQTSSTLTQLSIRFATESRHNLDYAPTGVQNGFLYPETPVIIDQEPSIIQLYRWGLIPSWSKDLSFRKNTLNARVETIDEKPSFRASVQQRCLILIDGFYEWQWLDEKGKQKQQYLITSGDQEPFALAGIWNEWSNKETGEVISSYSIVTTEANEQMAIIHNTKKRMPIILTRANEQSWLAGAPMQDFNLFPTLLTTPIIRQDL